MLPIPRPPLADETRLSAAQAAYAVVVAPGTSSVVVVVAVTVVVVVLVVVTVAESVAVTVTVASANVLVAVAVVVTVSVWVLVGVAAALTVVGEAVLVFVRRITFSTAFVQLTLCGYLAAAGRVCLPPFLGQVKTAPFLLPPPLRTRLSPSSRFASPRGT